MRPEIEERHLTITVAGTVIHFFCYNGFEDNRARIDEMAPYFDRLPPGHVDAIYPVLLIAGHPTRAAGTGGGGTMTAATGGFRGLTGHRGAEASGVPADHTEEILTELGQRHRTRGLHFIPDNRWANPVHQRALTLFHEIGHGVDYELSLTVDRHHTRYTPADLPGPFNPAECGGRYEEKQRAAIYYSHLIVEGTPFRIGSATDRATTLAALRHSLAFRDVPEHWWDSLRDW